MSQPRSGSNGAARIQSAVTQNASAEVLRLRKELIQQKNALTDIQEELDEKTNLYLEAIKQRDQYKERLTNASDNIKRVQDIVEQKVAAALQDKMREHSAMEQKNKALVEKEKLTDQTIQQMTTEKKLLLDKVQGLSENLAYYTRNPDTKDSVRRIDQLRQEKDLEAKKAAELIAEINTLSGQMENMMAENRALRQMANVPENYGIKLDQIKLHDKDKVADFKRLIKVLQDDNYKLEEERAKLKHALKVQSMMYKNSEPSDRYKQLTQDQLFAVDQFVLRLVSGETSDPSDTYALRRENESLKAQLEAMNAKGFEMVSVQIKEFFKGKNVGDNSSQLSKLIQDNEELRIMIAKLLEKGIQGGDFTTIGGYKPPSSYVNNRDQSNWRPPNPHPSIDGEVQTGQSYKFSSSFGVTDKDGRPGVSSSTVYEHAFLQLQLQECFELIKRKDENLKFQQIEIDSLYKRVRNYVLTQDQLYKDFVRMERAFNTKEQELKTQLRQVQDQILYEQQRVQKTEALLAAMHGGPDANASRLIELTKQNSILDVNLLKLTRKYQSLEEQEKLLRREYHAKDTDQAEKDLQTQWRINSLKEWKARAIQQLKFLHEKLRIAVPMSEFEIVAKDVEIVKQRTNDYIMRNAKLAHDKANLQKQLRNNAEAEVNLRHMKEAKEQALEEYEILKKRLEAYDPVFRFENTVFTKIAKVLLRAKISPAEAFATFDSSKDGRLSRKEFTQALEMMKVHDLTVQEIDVVWDSLDIDKSGSIDYKEFARKLEHYGVRNRSKEEIIITSMVEAVQRSSVKSLSNLFELIDTTGRGYIDRQEFAEIFHSLNLKIDEQELNRFMDNFWKDKEAGIDIQGFLRIFNKYQVKLDRRSSVNTTVKAVSDNTIRLKKKFYMDMQDAFKKTGKTLGELFRVADGDHSNSIGPQELKELFDKMRFKEATSSVVKEIFDSIDVDGSDFISLPELIADFKMVCARDVEELIRDEHSKRNEVKISNQSSHLSKEQISSIQTQTRIDIMHAEKKQLQRKLDTQLQILQNTENSLHVLQAQYNHIEKQNQEHTVTIFEMNDRNKQLEQSLRNCIKRDEAENLQVDNEKLKVELVETRAAMLSYKNMYNVIADQAKNLKLIQERKKDEHDNLMNALREMQSEGVNQERLGKLYFIIMLSRWQEASVNKRYDAVLTEVRELRSELVSATQMCAQKEIEHQEAETLLQKHNVDKEKLKGKVTTTSTSPNQLVELNQRIQDISDNLTDGEEVLMHLRTKYRLAQDQLDSAQVAAESAKDLLDKLMHSRPDELSNNLVKLSEKHSQIRLNELRSQRACADLEEKTKYLSSLLKSKNEALALLEEKASKAEAAVILKEEQFRKRENERTRQFFFINKFEDHADAGSKIQRAAGITTQGLSQRLDSQQINFSQKQNNELTAGWTKPLISQDNSDRINQLEHRLNEAMQQLQQRDATIQRFEQWQIGDKYLSQDEVLKDAIQEHRAKTSITNEKEQKEMADAAYQTIKTLQDMLDNKNAAIRAKEDQMSKLRMQMNDQREIDAQTIAQLRDQISITGNTTLARMQEIVSRQEVGQQVAQSKQAFSNKKNDLGDIKEFQRQLMEKDHIIQQLRARTQGHTAESALVSKKRDERNQEIDQLKQELLREKARNDTTGLQKKIDRMTKERKEQDQTIQQLNKAIDGFSVRMTAYEAEKLTLKDENECVKKKEQFGEVVLKKEIETLKNKMDIVESSKTAKIEEIKKMKVRVTELEAQLQSSKTENQEQSEKYQSCLKALEDERRQKGRIQAELNGYKEDAKIGGNVGGKMSYEQLAQRNRELEQDNKILECQKKTVVVYNKESATYEYIGEPRPLDYYQEVKPVKEILNKISIWLATHHRLSIGPILRALDKQNHGDLKEQQFVQALDKIGIMLQASELNQLKACLDVKQTGYIKYEPLVRQLQGISTEDFIIAPLRKLAKLVESRDFNRVNFRSLMDPKHEENMTLELFTKAVLGLNTNDFAINSDEAEQIYKAIVGVDKITINNQLQVTKLVDQVFEAVRAVLIERIRDQLRRSETQLIDLLQKHDSNKDGFLTYQELDNLLLELQVSVKTGIFNDILIGEMLDVGKRASKVSCDMIKFYIGCSQNVQDKSLDLQPGRDNQKEQRGNLSESQFEIARAAARKIVNHLQLIDVLNSKDSQKEGLLSNEQVLSILSERRVPDLQPSELNLLITFCDRMERDFLVISSFVSKVTELAQETGIEAQLRKFAGSVSRQGVNLRSELVSFETQHSGRLDKIAFKKALKQMALALTDAEIDMLFASAEIGQELLDIKLFVNKVAIASKQKPPAVSKASVKSDTKVQSKPIDKKESVFESSEMEKKYKKNLDALKQELEEKNREIQIKQKEVKDANEREQKAEAAYKRLEGRLVDRNAKPPHQMNQESQFQHSLDEIQKLKDEIHHLQQVNLALSKTVQVDLKAELGKSAQEKEMLEAKLKTINEKLRHKTNEVNQLVGRPLDTLARREEAEELRHKHMLELQGDNTELEAQLKQTIDKLFKAEEKLLDLKFEKETFDLQYARLQKRITDLEHYKLQSSQMSAVLKNQYQTELDKIKDETEKLRGDALSRQPSDTVKLRALKSKTAAELEIQLEQLRRVCDKQRVENDALKKANEKLETLTAKGSNEPQLKQKVEMLERVVHSYEMADVRTGEKDTTIKKLVFANKTLREDLEQEIERFTLLQNRYKELLIKFNILSKANKSNEQALFSVTTGAQMKNYEQFLDRDELNESLNGLNKND